VGITVSSTPIPRRWRELAVATVHLAVLWSAAVAQPLLDVLGDAPEFFVARENTRGDIVALALSLTLGPPLLLAVGEAVVATVSPAARRAAHLGLIALLATAFALQVVKDLAGGTAVVLIPVAVALGVAATAAYARTRIVPALLTALAPVPLVFIFAFLVLSPVSQLVFPREEAAAAPVAVRGDTPVVMIVFDEFSGLSLLGHDRRIDAARLPAFARLAGDSTWYRNATTVADFTERAIPALITGEMPERDSLPTAADHPESLFTLLGDAYSLDVTEPVTDVCPRRLCPETGRPDASRRLRELASDLSVVSLHLLLPDDLRRKLPPVDRSFGDFRRRGGAGEPRPWTAPSDALQERVGQFDAFVRRLGREQKPSLSFVHVELPHTPLEFLPTGQRYPGPAEPPGLEDPGVWTKHRPLVHEAHRRHLLQVAFADRLLGRALDRLRRAGLYERALIVVAADHGIGFRPGAPYRAAVEENLVEVASIPLLVKAPGQQLGRIDDSNIRSVDVLPTIAAALDADLPWSTDGRSPGRGRAPASVAVDPYYGDGVLRLPFGDFVRRRDALARRLAAEFGDGGINGLFRAGPDADLVGRPVVSLPARRTGRTRFELDDAALLNRTNPEAPVVPALLSGLVVGAPAGDRVAVALNGRIAAVTSTVRDGDAHRFYAMVPPRALARGSNRVAVIGISGTAARRRLVQLAGGGLAKFRLVERQGRGAIVDERGHAVRVEEGIEGFVEKVTIEDGVATVSGWAADTDAPRPAHLVVAFAGGRLVAAERPSLPRPDLAREFGAPLMGAGFELRGPVDSGERGRAPVRAFALIGGRASALPATGAAGDSP
jgi:hypothetical protein